MWFRSLILVLLAFYFCGLSQAAPRRAWSDGVLWGDELFVIYEDAPLVRERVRLAGINTVRPAGELATRLASEATLALAWATSGQTLEVDAIGVEWFTEWTATPRPMWLYKRRTVASVRIIVEGYPARDCASLLLRVGYAWLSFNYQTETETPNELFTINREAVEARRGVYRYGSDPWETFPPLVPPRNSDPRPQLPERNTIIRK